MRGKKWFTLNSRKKRLLEVFLFATEEKLPCFTIMFSDFFLKVNGQLQGVERKSNKAKI